jgi:hypothetical protein
MYYVFLEQRKKKRSSKKITLVYDKKYMYVYNVKMKKNPYASFADE